MDNEQFLKQSEEHVASVQAALQRAKKMIERTESLFRHFGFARGNDEAMFALPFIQKMADDIALIAKGERDYLEFMGFKEPEGGWPTLHLGIASSEEETAIDRLLAEAQAVPLKPRKEFLEEPSISVHTPRESTAEALAKIRSQMDALLANSKATLGTRNILKKTPPKSPLHKKEVNPLTIPQPISSIAQQPMPIAAVAPEPDMIVPQEEPTAASLKKDSPPSLIVPNEIQEIFSNEEKEAQPITLLKASSHRIHRHALANDIRAKMQSNILANGTKNCADGGKFIPSAATSDTLKSEVAAQQIFKAETQAALPQSSTPNLVEPLSSPSESSIIPSLAMGRRRFVRTRLTQEGDKLKIQKNIQL
ncbi:MAG: hypothetical protein LBG98_02115 [Puniceicoccales bacterium]|jgi:hypothetical protein|nr:hypothetical protein [Puniceicoccales bacterium]